MFCVVVVALDTLHIVKAWVPPVRATRSMRTPAEQTMSRKQDVHERSVHLQASVATDADTDQAVTGTADESIDNQTHHASPLALTIDELAQVVRGKGRALAIWDYYRAGLDPCDASNDSAAQDNDSLPVLGRESRALLKHAFPTGIEESVARVVHQTTSSDGTTKLLLQLHQDNLQVEAVIIPWPERSSSTLCVSSQVGCKQACTFCQTGRMGKLRDLTASEIVAQVWIAGNTCRANNIFPVDNVVFMGMGEPADNAAAVVRAAQVMTAPGCFRLGPRKVTISTVAPSPQAFTELGEAPAVLAWSVHGSRDVVRRELVPTTRHTMEELREGLIEALQKRSKRMRATMLEIAVIAGKNDSVEDALHLADFCQPLLDRVSGIKVVVNLIPWNDIGAPSGPAAEYKTPSPESVRTFQQTLMKRNILCYVRTTRGDDESAACGQLATKKRPGEALVN